jgi:hypothetical protein
VAVNRSDTYLFPAEVSDARALWVNPAGLGIKQEASVYFDLTVADPGSLGQLRQLNLGFNARGLAFGYQRDQFSGGTRGSTYKLGFGVGEGSLAAGLGAALYRGDTKGTGWDLGVTYKAAASLVLAGVIGNIGQPTVRGVEQRVQYTASAALQVAPGVGFGALARAGTSGMQAYGVDARFDFDPGFPLGFVARLDTDQKLRRTQFALGFSIGSLNQMGLVATSPGDASSINDVTLFGMTSRIPGKGR